MKQGEQEEEEEEGKVHRGHSMRKQSLEEGEAKVMGFFEPPESAPAQPWGDDDKGRRKESPLHPAPATTSG